MEHSVWDEPGLSPQLAGEVPEAALTYGAWLSQRIGETTWHKSWLVTVLVAVEAGPWAILGAFMRGGETVFGVVMLTVVGPLTSSA